MTRVPEEMLDRQSTIRQDADLTPFRLGITVTGPNTGSYRIDVSDHFRI